jgi:hypothetical protein
VIISALRVAAATTAVLSVVAPHVLILVGLLVGVLAYLAVLGWVILDSRR